MARNLYRVLLTIVLVSMILATPALAVSPQPRTTNSTAETQAPNQTVTVTILHTNDFHGNLEPVPSSSYPGMARTAAMIFSNTVEPSYTLVLDAGDIMQGTLLSNLFHGESTIDVYNHVGYDVATFGNHEFDWGQDILFSRTTEASFPFVSANVVVSDSGSCDTAGWQLPPFVDAPWVTVTLGTAPNDVVIGIIGVTTQETPFITVAWATAGLCFKDPAASIAHYWPELDAASDAIVVLSHLGLADGGYGYGFPVYGDRTLAHNLIDGGTPVNLIIGGHSHTNMAAAEIIGNGIISTTVAQAHSAGRKVGMATLTIDKGTGDVDVAWQRLTVGMTTPQDPGILAAIDVWASNPWYQAEINRVVGYTNVPIVRNYYGDSLMADFVDDSIYNDLNNDAEPLNDVDMFFNNAGGIRTDFTFPVTATYPQTITHGMMYNILPFGNATIVGDMTGAQVLDLLNQSATLFKGALQVSGIMYSFYCYTNTLPGPQPWAWGAYDIAVWNPGTSTWDPLDLGRTYRVGTNEFLAPAGQDGYTPFKYMVNTSYWGDMLNAVEDWVSKTYTISNPYSETLDARIIRNGAPGGLGTVVPVTLLHHNDQHGNLIKGAYVGWTQLASLVAQERAKNPDALLLNAGDTIQGDSMSYYFKSAGFGYAADGTTIITPSMHIQPAIAVMNAMTYTAMTLGNHEFNFGNDIFTSVMGLANFPILGANIHDDGQYGLATVGVQPYITVSVPVSGSNPIDIAILGLANHRVPNYELPSNIPGLSFTNPISEAQMLLPGLVSTNDAVVALTHIGFTTNPASVEVDNNVDTYLAAQTSGLAAIIGGHSHTDPSKQTAASGDYKYLPALVEGADGNPVIINQAYRYNNYLGQVVLGFLPDGMGGYDFITRAGRYIKVDLAATPEDPTILNIVQPYQNMLNAYNNRFLGYTTTPIDALNAFTQETNAANMQADAAVAELAQNGVTVDFHLSGAMTNKAIAAGATVTNPYTLTVANMFTLMPYENSLVALQMNGPQLKTILERGYRNYYYYKYVPGQGGYSYYTTCMLDTNSGNQIIYRDTAPYLPDGHNVVALIIGGQPVDFLDATTYYTVSTVNYLAAGSCNFNDSGVTLWPLDQIVADTQYYVRDAVINYTMAQGTVSPAIEGRLMFLDQFVFLPILFK